MTSILFYSEKDPYYQFSNFYLAEITVEGIKYPSTEYYYQAQKFMGPSASVADLAYAEKIRSVNTSNKAYYLAKQIVRGGYAAHWYVSATDKTLLNDLIKQSKKDSVTSIAPVDLDGTKESPIEVTYNDRIGAAASVDRHRLIFYWSEKIDRLVDS